MIHQITLWDVIGEFYQVNIVYIINMAHHLTSTVVIIALSFHRF